MIQLTTGKGCKFVIEISWDNHNFGQPVFSRGSEEPATASESGVILKGHPYYAPVLKRVDSGASIRVQSHQSGEAEKKNPIL